MKAAFGLRLLLALAGFLAAAFFIGFFAGALLAAGFFAAFLPFFAAIDESSNLVMTLGRSVVHPALTARQREDAQGENALSTDFTRKTPFSPSVVAREQHARSIDFRSGGLDVESLHGVAWLHLRRLGVEPGCLLDHLLAVHEDQAVGHLDVGDGRIGRELQRLAEVLLALVLAGAVG